MRSNSDLESIKSKQQNKVSSSDLTIHVKAERSKIVFDARPVGFSVDIPGQTESINCAERAFMMIGDFVDLYAAKWPKDYPSKVKEGITGEYEYTHCRAPNLEVIAWYANRREFEFDYTYQVLHEDYSPKKFPLNVMVRSLIDDSRKYFACSDNNKFSRTKISETEKSEVFDLALTCDSQASPPENSGLPDFIESPGEFAALMSYRGFQLPSVEASSKALQKVKKALLKKIPAGKYSKGAMKVLSNLCTIEIIDESDSLTVRHTTISSGRVREEVLTSENLMGFIEGKLYSDPLRVTESIEGSFAAVEFSSGKNKKNVVLRFEDNKTADGQIIRINGSDTYCRRLEK